MPVIAASPSPAPVATLLPTPGQNMVILVAPPEAGPLMAQALTALAASTHWAFETRPTLTAAELKPEFKIVVFLQTPPDLPAWLAAAPQTQFVVTGGSELEAKANLSVIRQREEFRSFMAGYITVLVAPDWRGLGLMPAAPAQLVDAFINGGRFWCGRCIPIHGPVVLFPLVSALPAGTALADWQKAVSTQQKNVIESIYISPEAYSLELVKSLFTQKLILVGSQPPAAEITPLWAATLSFDPVPALQKIWPDLAAAKGGQTADASLAWSSVNEDWFSVGKQRLAQDILTSLLNGTIGPFSVPTQ